MIVIRATQNLFGGHPSSTLQYVHATLIISFPLQIKLMQQLKNYIKIEVYPSQLYIMMIFMFSSLYFCYLQLTIYVHK